MKKKILLLRNSNWCDLISNLIFIYIVSRMIHVCVYIFILTN